MGLIAGTVVAADGRPVAGARVAIVAGPGAWPEIAALTDATGRFALAAPAPGRYRVGVATDANGAGEAEIERLGAVPAETVVRLSR